MGDANESNKPILLRVLLAPVGILTLFIAYLAMLAAFAQAGDATGKRWLTAHTRFISKVVESDAFPPALIVVICAWIALWLWAHAPSRTKRAATAPIQHAKDLMVATDPIAVERENMAEELAAREAELSMLEERIPIVSRSYDDYIMDHKRWMNDQFFHYKAGHAKIPRQAGPFLQFGSTKYVKLPYPPELLEAGPVFEPHPDRPNDSNYVAAKNMEYIGSRIENLARIGTWKASLRPALDQAKADTEELKMKILRM